MSRETTHYNLTIPELDDPIDVDVLSDALESMDGLIYVHENDAKAYVDANIETLVKAEIGDNVAQAVADYIETEGLKVEVGDVLGAIGSVVVGNETISPTGESHSVTLPSITGSSLEAGLVPARAEPADKNKFLRGDGTWQVPYTLPAATASQLGGVKVGGNMAIDNNGVLTANVSHVYSVTVPTRTGTGYWVANGADGYMITLQVEGLLASDTPVIALEGGLLFPSGVTEAREAFACIYNAETGADTLTLYATAVPGTAINLLIKVVR